MRFIKMNGLGNDYIFIDISTYDPKLTKEDIIKLSDRNFGIGGDGVVTVNKSSVADFEMQIYNSDGTRAEMCGNALRCFAKLVLINKMTNKKHLKIKTGGGIRYTTVNQDGTVSANMAAPIVDNDITYLHKYGIYGYKINVSNPHFVVINNDNATFDKYANMISSDLEYFPMRTNVEFTSYDKENNSASVRVYERGSKETLACGTGATAVFELGCKLGKLSDGAVINLRGGKLHCSHNANGEVLLTGRAELNFIGETSLLDK